MTRAASIGFLRSGGEKIRNEIRLNDASRARNDLYCKRLKSGGQVGGSLGLIGRVRKLILLTAAICISYDGAAAADVHRSSNSIWDNGSEAPQYAIHLNLLSYQLLNLNEARQSLDTDRLPDYSIETV